MLTSYAHFNPLIILEQQFGTVPGTHHQPNSTAFPRFLKSQRKKSCFTRDSKPELWIAVRCLNIGSTDKFRKMTARFY
jgi:hypothetical protein